MPTISRLPQVLCCLSLSSSSPLQQQQKPTFKFSLLTPSSSSSLYHFKFRPKRSHFLKPCSSLKETKKQQTLSKVPSTAPPPQGLKRLLNLSPKDDDDDGGDSTAVTGTILAGLLLLGVVGGFGAVGYFYRDQINSFLTQFSGFIEGYGPAGYALFVLVYAGLEVLAIPAIPLTMSAGLLFGSLIGTIIVSISGTVAASVSFLIARYFARERILKLVEGNKKFLAIDKAIGENGFKVVTLLRLSPLLPFSLGNYLYGLTSVKFVPYVLGSWLGMLPGSWAYVSAGAFGRAILQEESDVGLPGGNGQLITLGLGLLFTALAATYVTRLAKCSITYIWSFRFQLLKHVFFPLHSTLSRLSKISGTKLMKSIVWKLTKPNPFAAGSLLQTLFRRSDPDLNPSLNSVRSLSSYSYNYSDPGSGVSRESVDCVVIGAGVIGIAVARELSLKHGREVLVIESGPTFGTGTSSRNSEVIHAGIYYPSKSLKALFCVRGRKLLYSYCRENGIPHKQIGKLIVATAFSDVPKLDALFARGNENGVDGLRLLERAEAVKLEPELHCVKALLSSTSGIVDTHSLMLSLVGEAECQGTIFSYNTSVIGGCHEGNSLQLHVSQSSALKSWDRSSPLHPELILIPKLVVNAAGLSAPAVARRFYGLNNNAIPTSYYARGCYFALSNSLPPFHHLIYPIPEDGGLGVHVTIDLNGQVKFGPDVEWIDENVDDISSFLNMFDYSVRRDRAKKFYPEIRKYYPDLKDGSLEPGYAGIRPKLSGPRQVPSDFVIQGEEDHGIPGLVNLFGIESPGLTSSLAISEYVAHKLMTR
ncbi:OLC1v1018493C1 [Oldenlandia corymbosa var. corymbosa]|uniref:L-2-hydroxyglutarate dehydrogenase, mitochondrial n=1 Tax=Oldenlandia corymbosa var. corymbosa TaxID=529605 RepID=A0AAV1EBP7_OLDCO|nr:OLC1v1018493C1 [Oldenlandia corymbosa var. corymbosa]